MPPVIGPSGRCPACRALLDGHSASDGSDRRPEAGDAVVCVYCRTILLVTDGPVLYRVATQAELDDLPRELWAELHTIVTMLERYADCAGHKPLS